MARYSREPNDCKVYVGDLQKDASEKELERAFAYYGRLKSVWVARNPPGFAFVEFEDYRDAEDAVRGLDGTYMCGGRARVELSTGKVRPKPWARGGRGGGGGGGGGGSRRRAFNPEDRCYECGDRGHYAYDCSKSRGGRGHGGSGGSGGGGSRSSRRRSRSYSRSYSRSRSRDRGRRDSYSKSRSRSPYRRSRSPQPRSRSRSASRHSN